MESLSAESIDFTVLFIYLKSRPLPHFGNSEGCAELLAFALTQLRLVFFNRS